MSAAAALYAHRAVLPLLPLLAACGVHHPPAACDVQPPVAASTTPPSAPLYGFWGLNGYTHVAGLQDVRARLGATVYQVAASSPEYAVRTLLPDARAAGMKITLRMTPDHGAYTTLTGSFDLDAWKASLDGWVGSGVQAFVDDGTLVGHMLLDDIHNFNGRDPDAADLEEMARCSKALFPGLMTYVRERAAGMPVPKRGTYQYVDAAVNQYQVQDGEIHAYTERESARAAELDLGVINGLNIADGGDGSSQKAGYRAGFWAMSADEITRYGAILADVPTCGMFLNWEYDGEERWADGSVGSVYFDRPDVQAALLGLSRRVSGHAPAPLLKPWRGG